MLGFFPLVLALVGATSVSAASTPPLQITPNNIAIHDADFAAGKPVQFKLSEKPTDNVVVAFDALPLITMDLCVLTFTPSNWNKSQTVTVYPVSSAIASNDVKADLKINVYSAGGNGTSSTNTCTKTVQTIPVARSVVAAQICNSVGDPHIKTFDGATFMTPAGDSGYFTLFQSDDLQTVVQVHHYNCSRSATCNDRVAIKHYDSFLMLPMPSYNMTPEYIPGSKHVMTFANSTSPNSYDISLDDGTKINVAFLFWQATNDYYGNVQITAAGTFHSRVSGLCGNFNDNSTDDAITDYSKLSIVPGSNKDLFSCKNQCAGFPSDAHGKTSCLVPVNYKPAICNPKPVSTTTRTTTSTTKSASSSKVTSSLSVTKSATASILPAENSTTSSVGHSTTTKPATTKSSSSSPATSHASSTKSASSHPSSTRTSSHQSTTTTKAGTSHSTTPAAQHSTTTTTKAGTSHSTTPSAKHSTTTTTKAGTSHSTTPSAKHSTTTKAGTSHSTTPSAKHSTTTKAGASHTTKLPSTKTKSAHTSSATVVATQTPAAIISVETNVTVVEHLPIKIGPYDGIEDKITYCLRVTEKFKDNSTESLIYDYCHTDVVISVDVTGCVSGLIAALQEKAKAEALLTISATGGDPSADISNLMQKFQLSVRVETVTKYFNPTYGGVFVTQQACENAGTSGVVSAASSYQMPAAPSVPCGGSVLKCRLRSVS